MSSTQLPPEDLDKSFAVGVGKRVKAVRERAGRTQADVAEVLGFSVQSVSAWEGGRREPGLRTLANLARYLETSVAAFFPDAEHGWEAPVESPDERLARVERQIKTLRDDYYADRDALAADGLLAAK